MGCIIDPITRLSVTLPNKDQLHTIGSTPLALPGLPPVPGHVFAAGQLHTTLAAVVDYTDLQCDVTFKNTGACINCPGSAPVFFPKQPSDRLFNIAAGFTPAHRGHAQMIGRGGPGEDQGALNGQVHLAMNARNQTNNDKVRFMAASFMCTPDSTLARAVEKGWIYNWPTIVTAAMIRANPTAFTATAFGHLEQQRMYRDKQSRVPGAQRPAQAEETYSYTDDYDNAADDESADALTLLSVENTLYSDWIAKFPWISAMGNQYILTFKYRNYLHYELAPTLTAYQHLEAFKRAFIFFSKHHAVIKHKFLDNQLANEIFDLFELSGIKVHKAPPKLHRANDAEGAIKHTKAHIISGLSNADPTFDAKANWDDIILFAELTINHLRGWAPDRKISAWHGLHGVKFDFSERPIAPFGTNVIVYNPRDDTSHRSTWGLHGEVAHYIGPAKSTYRAHAIRVVGSPQTRHAPQLAWFPHNVNMPGWSTAERILAALQDLTFAFQSASQDNPALAEATPHMSQALGELRALYSRFQFADGLAYPPLPDAPADDSPFLRAITAAQERGLSALQHLSVAEKQKQWEQQRFLDYLALQQRPDQPLPPVPGSQLPPAAALPAPQPPAVPLVPAPPAPVAEPLPAPIVAQVPQAVPAPIVAESIPAQQRDPPAVSPAPVFERANTRSRGHVMGVAASNPLLDTARARTPTVAKPPALPTAPLSTAPEPKRGWTPRAKQRGRPHTPPRSPVHRHTAAPAAAPQRVPLQRVPRGPPAPPAPPQRVPRTVAHQRQHTTDLVNHATIAATIDSTNSAATIPQADAVASLLREDSCQPLNTTVAHPAADDIPLQAPTTPSTAYSWVPTPVHGAFGNRARARNLQTSAQRRADAHAASACHIDDTYNYFATAPRIPLPPALVIASGVALAVTAGLLNAALNLTPDGQLLTFNRAVNGPNSLHWRKAEVVELHRLLGTSNTSTPTMHAMHQSDLPPDRLGDVSYYNPQTKEKLNDAGETTYRVRGTFGGDRCNYPFSAFAATASMVLVKMLLQSVISDGVRFMTIDIKDYYLKTPMARPEYIRLRINQLPPEIQSTYNLAQYVHHDTVLFQVNQTMYGLPQAGILSQQRLIAHLATSGYHQCPRTPCLFRHVDNGITFTLVVDDFGVKYTTEASVHHLLACLESLYDLHIDWTGTKYLGMRFAWSASSVKLSIPGYIEKALARFGAPAKGAASPAVYLPPQYGKGTQFASIDTSTPLAPADVTRVQEIVGVFLYYARCIDARMLPAVNDIASCQSDLRASVWTKVDRLLAYASTHSDAQLELRACDMILHIQSDGSYLSRARSRSVNGGLFYLGDVDCPTLSNGPILAVSSIIPVVVASAAEAELASLFMNAQHGAQLRTILDDLGYPQPPTVILCDNSCAVGIAQNSIQQKHSKAIDMRFYWVQDRVAQGQFVVLWRAGITNLADYFTKALPVAEYEDISPLLVFTP